jgi:kinesin family protein 2/24
VGVCVMISAEHTLNTLRYADRVKELKKNQAGQRGRKVEKKAIVDSESDEAGDEKEEDSSLGMEDSDDGSVDLPFQTDDDIATSVDALEIAEPEQDDAEKDEIWKKSRLVIEAHSKSVDKLLKLLRLEECLLRDLLNDQTSLGEYYESLEGMLDSRIDETMKVYTLLKEN